MRSETLDLLLDLANAGRDQLSSQAGMDAANAVMDAGIAELEQRQAPITVEAMTALKWRKADATFYCPATDGFDFELFVELNEGVQPIVAIFINGEYVSLSGVDSVADLLDQVRLLTGKDVMFSIGEQPNT